MSTHAIDTQRGIFENQFKIETDVKKLCRINLKTHLLVFLQFYSSKTRYWIWNTYKIIYKPWLCILCTIFSGFFPFVCLCVCLWVSICLSVCLYPRSKLISQSILKCDISTDAVLQPEGVAKIRFDIKTDIEKLFRKNA